MDNQAGPSRPKQPATAPIEPKEDVDDPRPSAPQGGNTAAQAEEGDEDEERMDFKAIESIASKIQYAEGSGRPKINIPKRGEKDFEPLQETVNLQEMMLQKSREALFNALVGVRGGNSKAMSHALLTPNSPYPKMLITRGHIHDSLGIAVRQQNRFSRQTTVELLPEEALYLLERGSLQIWIGPEPETETDYALGVGTWKDEEYGVKGAVEMSVMEGYGCFIGKEGLTWERYQAYAYLKRLGYTVQRTPQFIPDYFDPPRLHPTKGALEPFRPWWFSLPRWIGRLISSISSRIANISYSIAKVGMDFSLRWTREPFKGTLLSNWHGSDYSSIFSHLRIVPTGHTQPLPPRPTPPTSENIYDALIHNPYLPFYHIWKPATPWSKAKWEKGTEEVLARQKPDYYAAIIDGRTVPMPTIHQLSQIFETLPDEPTGPIKRVGPQYAHRNRPRPNNTQQKELTWYERLFPFLVSKEEAKPYVNPMGALRNGDRALIVAVNDSGNTGWVRFGRSGFAEAAVM